MTQEDKKLLLKDLCSRLPYGVIAIDNRHGNSVITEINTIFATVYCYDFDEYVRIENVKLYLRPMSSMTEEEKEEIALIRDRDFQSVRKWIHDESIKEIGNICPITCGEIDFCNKRHLDYRGLIEKGLALEAPEGMY